MGDSEMCTCPYEPSHVVLKSRLQNHLVKCQKNHPKVYRDTCPFNATHRIPRPEMSMHLASCPDKAVIESHKYQVVGNSAPNIQYTMPKLPPCEENWDDDAVDSTYDPSNENSAKAVLRNLPGATKSERKHFRNQERKRIANLNKDLDSTKPFPDDEPLRLPKTSYADHKLLVGSRLGMGRGLLSRMPDNSNSNEDISHKPIGRGRGMFQ